MGFKIHLVLNIYKHCICLATCLKPMAKIRGNEITWIRRIRGLISLMKSDNPEITGINDEAIYVLFSIKIQWVGYKVDTMMDEI